MSPTLSSNAWLRSTPPTRLELVAASCGQVRREKPKVKIALVGKYVELHDAYMSVREALKHAALHLGVEVEILWIHATDLERGRSLEMLEQAHGILVPGGFGSRGIEGKILAARYARTHKVPYLGLCLGMQLMVVEFARHIFNDERANSTEFDRTTPYPVIDLLPEQQQITEMGGTMRLGLYPCQLKPGTKAAQAYQETLVQERHRHRFEFNNTYREIFEKAGMVFSGLSPDASGGNRRVGRSSFYVRHAVSSRIPLPSHPSPSSFQGIC